MLAPSNVPISLSTGVAGWETIAEETKLVELAQRFVPENGIVVELGGEYGRSMSQFCYALQKKKGIRFYTVDIFPKDHPFAKQFGGLFNVWQANLEEKGYKVEPIIGDTAQIGREIWSDQEIDLLFVDAGHTYQEVKADLEAWTRHVKSGGVVICHDYWKNELSHPLHMEVKHAVDEFCNLNNYKLIDAPDSLVWFMKPIPTVPSRNKSKKGE